MWRYKNITTQLTTMVAAPPCELIAVVVNTGAASAVCKIFDTNDLSPSGQNAPLIATIDASATNNFFYGNTCLGGITAVTSGGNADLTVIWSETNTETDDPPAYSSQG
jgi:hypothetical protein